MENIDPALADKAVGYLRRCCGARRAICSSRLPVTNVKSGKNQAGYGNGLYRPAGEHSVNYIFIYGHFGMPELGGVGVAWLLRRCIGSCSLPWFLTLTRPLHARYS